MSEAPTASSAALQLERSPCPLCGGHRTHVVVSTPDLLGGIPGEFTVEACQQCGHRFLNPRPTPAALAACYPAHYGPHQSRLPSATAPLADTEAVAAAGTDSEAPAAASAAAGRPWYLRYLPLKHIPGLRSLYYWLLADNSQPVPPAASFRTAGPAAAPPRALELGCATGRYLRLLQQAGWEVVGVEPSTPAAAAARAAGLPVLTGTLDTVRLDDQSFDLVAAWMVLEHVPEPRATLQTIHELLRPSGRLLLSIPNAGCWEPRVFGRSWYSWEPPRHLQHFTPRSIRRLLTECGFTSISIQHQQNLSNVLGSAGLLLHRCCPGSRLGQRLIDYPTTPGTVGQLLSAPLAHLLAWLRQGGRLTISATRR